MVEIRTAARPYAEAVFDIARNRNDFARWSDMLSLLVTVVADARIAALADDPRIGRERLEQLLLDICGPRLDPDGVNFLKLLVDNRRLLLLPEIAELYEALRAEAEKRVEVTVRTALALDAKQQELLEAALKRRFGRQVQMTVTVDPALIGGVEIRAGDLVIDGSAKGRLQELAAHLNQP